MSEVDWTKAPDWANHYGYLSKDTTVTVWLGFEQYAYTDHVELPYSYKNRINTINCSFDDFTITESRPADQPDFPDFPFKIRNGDQPEVRQWLKDNGCSWCDGSDPFDHLPDKEYLYVHDFKDFNLEFDSKEDWDRDDTPEVELKVETKYSWSKVEPTTDPDILKEIEETRLQYEKLGDKLEQLESKLK